MAVLAAIEALNRPEASSLKCGGASEGKTDLLSPMPLASVLNFDGAVGLGPLRVPLPWVRAKTFPPVVRKGKLGFPLLPGGGWGAMAWKPTYVLNGYGR